LLIRRYAELRADCLDIRICVVIVGWRRPAINDVADGINALTLVRQQVAAKRADAVLWRFEFGKATIVTGLPTHGLFCCTRGFRGCCCDAARAITEPPSDTARREPVAVSLSSPLL
jgi:hypothetical protein